MILAAWAAAALSHHELTECLAARVRVDAVSEPLDSAFERVG